MPRAHRYHLPGYIWHLTQRCHRRQFLLKFARDRRAWVGWLHEARRRYDLCVLDYTVTCNHIHLLVRDQGRGEIARSLQLIAGPTGQAFNRRKRRPGAFWEDRYHATAVDTGEHLARCVAYIDLNMVRAGVVTHPQEWESGGYHEIQAPRVRYRIVDREALAAALGLDDVTQLARVHSEWINAALQSQQRDRRVEWTESVAVGSRAFVERVEAELGMRSLYRSIYETVDGFTLREPSVPFQG
jgi:REP-associated tyrosine transposase